MPEDKQPTIDPKIGKLLTPDEVAMAYAVPALSANRFFIQPVASGARIAFGEHVPGSDDIQFRIAVTLSNEDAVQLYKLLQHMMREFEEALTAHTEEAKAQADV